MSSFRNYFNNLDRKRRLKGFTKEFRQFSDLAKKSDERFPLSWEDKYPCLDDRTSDTPFDRHYIYHPAWAARILKQTNPDYHVDISSTLNFCAIVSAFIRVEFYDYRPANLALPGLTSGSADLTSLHFADNSIGSLSCMHTIEHIGLGRYGDPLDYDGDLKAISELKRVVRGGGDLLFVVPIGKPRIMFNAHRIYSYDQVLDYFKGFELMEFSLIPEYEADGGLLIHANKEMADKETYGCGCFWFRKSE